MPTAPEAPLPKLGIPAAIEARLEVMELIRNVDYCEVKIVDSAVEMEAFIAGLFSFNPWWVRALFQVRKFFVWLFSLERHDEEGFAPLREEDIAYDVGSEAGFFTVTMGDKGRHWIGVTPPDKHLTAYLGVVAEDLDDASEARHRRRRYHVLTLVDYLHWTGPVYFNTIRLFHHLVINAMIRRAGGRLVKTLTCAPKMVASAGTRDRADTSADQPLTGRGERRYRWR